MTSVIIGPFSLPIGYIMLMLAFGIAILVGSLVGRRTRSSVISKLGDIFLVTVVVARLGFIIRYFEFYRDDWLGMVDIRDGGFDPWFGLAGTVLMALFWYWRHADVRKPLAIAVSAGVVAWLGIWGGVQMVGYPNVDVPELELVDLQGEPHNLAVVGAGGPRVVNLWATWCGPCVREMPVLEAAQQEYPDITFIFVNQAESPARGLEFLSEQGLNLRHSYYDLRAELPAIIQSRGLPTTLFYDADGTLQDTHAGELSRATLAQGLSKILPDN
ncbi:MAG: TlpA disulfide reductase family protein [Saccharospirillum sp.]|uniref:TlpA disulfide reductase family protein n=1 Tax=Saccharospirillum sp. TaxID=2033801 RepID=UPI003297AAE8